MTSGRLLVISAYLCLHDFLPADDADATEDRKRGKIS